VILAVVNSNTRCVKTVKAPTIMIESLPKRGAERRGEEWCRFAHWFASVFSRRVPFEKDPHPPASFEKERSKSIPIDVSAGTDDDRPVKATSKGSHLPTDRYKFGTCLSGRNDVVDDAVDNRTSGTTIQQQPPARKAREARRQAKEKRVAER
jgi:hypothetical protein